MAKNRLLLKKLSVLIALALFFTCSSTGQNYGKITNPSFRYVAEPGYVNTVEITGAIGLSRDSTGGIGVGDKVPNSKYFFGASNIFGYQIDRHFAAGIGVGFYKYDNSSLVPLYIDLRYIAYLKHIHPFFFANGGYMFDIANFFDNSDIFINPGLGLSYAVNSNLEGSLGAGLMVQSSNIIARRAFLNLKLRISFRARPFRMFKEETVKS